MVEEDWGRDLALLVARRLVLFLKRPGGQSQFSVPLRAQSEGDGPLAAIVDWILDHPDRDHRTEVLADRAGMTPRTFHRAFLRTVGQTPASFVESVRIEHARRLLEDGDGDVASVAKRSGFGDAERMRRAFLRQLKVNPTTYRSRFQPTSPAPADARLKLEIHERSGAAPRARA
jgi:transcriptional regulator GlxA family with amidase domain